MVKYVVVSVVMLLASWSLATSSHAGFSIDLPGFSLNAPLPGVGLHIGLPVVAVSSHQREAWHEPPVYVRPNGRFHENRPYYHREGYRHQRRDFDRGRGRFGGDDYNRHQRYR